MTMRRDDRPTAEEVLRVTCGLAFVVALAAAVIVILLRVT